MKIITIEIRKDAKLQSRYIIKLVNYGQFCDILEQIKKELLTIKK